jgi:hypothetical protein
LKIIKLSVLILLLTPLFWVRGALAEEECLEKLGPYHISFSAYHVLSAGDRKCRSIPAVGPVTLTIDFSDRVLREMKSEVRLIQAESWDAAKDEESDATGKTLVTIPPKTYPQGLVMLEQKFAEPGFFVCIVTLEDSAGKKQVVRFPFRVATSSFFDDIELDRSIVYYMLALFFLIALGTMGFIFTHKEKPKA